MRKLVLLLVLLTVCITPYNSHEYYEVSDADMMATEAYSSEYRDRTEPIFAHEATSPICVKQMIQPKSNRINYWIFIKNTGETELTNITLIITPPPNVTHRSSVYFRNPDQGRVNISEVMYNRDGTTKTLILNPKNLNTGDLTGILATFDRKELSDPANDQRNMVEVRAAALNPSDKELFEKTLIDIAIIDVVSTDPIVNGNVTTYNIQVKNDGKTRLTCVVLDATLPDEIRYRDSKYNLSRSQDSSPLPKPTEMIDSNGTTYLSWFLGDLETGSYKSIDLNVTCSDDRCPDLSDDNLQASGQTSILYKIPIKVTSSEDQMKGMVVVETRETAPSSGVNRSSVSSQ